MKLYEILLPIAKLVDRVGKGPGLSLIVVGKRPDGARAAAEVEAKIADHALVTP